MKNPNSTTSPAGTTPEMWYLTRGLTRQLLATGDEAPQEPGPPPKLPNSPLHHALIPFLKSHGIVACLPPPTPDQHGPIGRETKLSTSQVQTGKLQKVLQFTVELLLLTRNVQMCLSILTYIPKAEPRSHRDANAHLFFFKSTRQSKKKEARTSNSQSPRLST